MIRSRFLVYLAAFDWQPRQRTPFGCFSNRNVLVIQKELHIPEYAIWSLGRDASRPEWKCHMLHSTRQYTDKWLICLHGCSTGPQDEVDCVIPAMLRLPIQLKIVPFICLTVVYLCVLWHSRRCNGILHTGCLLLWKLLAWANFILPEWNVASLSFAMIHYCNARHIANFCQMEHCSGCVT